MLRVAGLTRNVRKRSLLEDVSFVLERGRILAILGPSGSGKTTVLRALMGLDECNQGTIAWNDQILVENGASRVPAERRPFGLVMQDPVLFPHLSVIENVCFGLESSEAFLKLRKGVQMLKLLRAETLARRQVHGLSGGERQRVALARALAPHPELLLLDEPFANVDRLVRGELITSLREVFHEMKISTIIVTHDARDALELADDVLVVRDGCVAQMGPVSDVLAHPGDEWVRKFLVAGLGDDHPALHVAA